MEMCHTLYLWRGLGRLPLRELMATELWRAAASCQGPGVQGRGKTPTVPCRDICGVTGVQT